MRKLVVGCGYLGRRVARAWVSAGDDVYALTRSESRGSDFRTEGIQPVIGDVTRSDTLDALPEVDTVLYAVGFDRNAGHSMREVYVDGLRNVLDRVAASTGRFLYISSTSVYGQSAGEWVDEDSPCDPTRPNGVICLEAEGLVRAAFPSSAGDHPGECSANVLRLAGIYGPDRLLRRIVSVKAGEPVSGNPDAWLNLIHVDDAVRSVLACAAEAPQGRTYLVCDDEPLTRSTYYKTLAELLDAPPPSFETTDEMARNKRCRNSRLRTELSVSLEFPAARAGLRHALGLAESR